MTEEWQGTATGEEPVRVPPPGYAYEFGTWRLVPAVRERVRTSNGRKRPVRVGG